LSAAVRISLVVFCVAVAACATPVTSPPGLFDAELLSITSGSWIPIPADAPPPKVDAHTAEATVRAIYRGARVTIDVRRISMRLARGVITGWVVGLTPEAGVPCINHPGLQPRAFEGGIVDDQTGDMFWTMTCW